MSYSILRMIIYRAQTKFWGKVMFLHLSVILFTEEVCIPTCIGVDTPVRHPPLGRHLPRQTPSSRYPQADTPNPRQTPPGRHSPGRYSPDTAGYGQEAGGTPPTIESNGKKKNLTMQAISMPAK